MTGGPDGDLGSNEILRSKEKILGVVDGSGVIFDPQGINRPELLRLCGSRQMICGFDASKLGPGGFKVLVDDKNVTLPNGFVVENGLWFRNNFHFNPLCQADFLVPCGGRPKSITAADVDRLVSPNGQLKYKYIVEGANLFVAEDARILLEHAGLIVIKDAAANKGGVTSSALEVLAGLVMPESDYRSLMCPVGRNKPSAFRERYVEEVIETVTQNARAEFELIWREHAKNPKMTYTELINKTATKINLLFEKLSENADRLHLSRLGRSVFEKHHVPKVLLERYGADFIINALPPKYLRALLARQLATHYVYTEGLDADEISFYRFFSCYQ
jgi:glutamate dehydrogenase